MTRLLCWIWNLKYALKSPSYRTTLCSVLALLEREKASYEPMAAWPTFCFWVRLWPQPNPRKDVETCWSVARVVQSVLIDLRRFYGRHSPNKQIDLLSSSSGSVPRSCWDWIEFWILRIVWRYRMIAHKTECKYCEAKFLAFAQAFGNGGVNFLLSIAVELYFKSLSQQILCWPSNVNPVNLVWRRSLQVIKEWFCLLRFIHLFPLPPRGYLKTDWLQFVWR